MRTKEKTPPLTYPDSASPASFSGAVDEKPTVTSLLAPASAAANDPNMGATSPSVSVFGDTAPRVSASPSAEKNRTGQDEDEIIRLRRALFEAECRANENERRRLELDRRIISEEDLRLAAEARAAEAERLIQAADTERRSMTERLQAEQATQCRVLVKLAEVEERANQSEADTKERGVLLQAAHSELVAVKREVDHLKAELVAARADAASANQRWDEVQKWRDGMWEYFGHFPDPQVPARST
jgi:hypothetical protein